MPASPQGEPVFFLCAATGLRAFTWQ